MLLYFLLILITLQSVEKLKGDESMKVSFGVTEAGAVYFTCENLFHLFIFIWREVEILCNISDLQLLLVLSLSMALAPLRKSDFSVPYSEQPARETATPHVVLRAFISEAALLLEHLNKSHGKSQGLGSDWDSRTDSLQPLCRGDPFAQLGNALGERQDLFC